MSNILQEVWVFSQSFKTVLEFILNHVFIKHFKSIVEQIVNLKKSIHVVNNNILSLQITLKLTDVDAEFLSKAGSNMGESDGDRVAEDLSERKQAVKWLADTVAVLRQGEPIFAVSTQMPDLSQVFPEASLPPGWVPYFS